jgi:hypothetical protein
VLLGMQDGRGKRKINNMSDKFVNENRDFNL